jgi:hypothetical protein
MLMSFQTIPEWFTVAGLAIDIVAVLLLAWELLLSKAAPNHAGGPASSSPWRRLRENKMTALCVLLLVIGFGLQIVGGWPR